jgi:hypothetical protein
MPIPVIVVTWVALQVLDFLKEDTTVVNVEIFFVQFTAPIILDLINLHNFIPKVYYLEDVITVLQIIYNGKRSCGKWVKKIHLGGQVLLKMLKQH